jgi:transposase-like protein
MKKPKIIEGRKCPKCEDFENQIFWGFNLSRTRKCRCKKCGCNYTLDPKTRAYPDEFKEMVIREYFISGSGRGVAKVHGIGKESAIRWIKQKEMAKKNHEKIVDKSSN